MSGLVQVDYLAQQSLTDGHLLDEAVTINIELSRRDRDYRPSGKRNIAIDGTTVDTVHRRDAVYRLSTIIYDDGPETAPAVDNDLMVEFLDSVATGQIFQMDLTGVLEDYVIDSFTRPYRAQRVGLTNLFRYTFTVRQRTYS
jgi:hypothetical protein